MCCDNGLWNGKIWINWARSHHLVMQSNIYYVQTRNMIVCMGLDSAKTWQVAGSVYFQLNNSNTRWYNKENLPSKVLKDKSEASIFVDISYFPMLLYITHHLDAIYSSVVSITNRPLQLVPCKQCTGYIKSLIFDPENVHLNGYKLLVFFKTDFDYFLRRFLVVRVETQRENVSAEIFTPNYTRAAWPRLG